jgi:ribokinase
MRLCALGDLLLDVIVRTDGSSGPDSEGNAETRVGAGGQAANVAAWAASLGAEARFVGKRAADGAGELAARELASRGVDVLGPVALEGRNGVVVSLVDPEGARTMLSDRGVAPELRAEDLDVRWFGGCEWLHLSGYSLFRRPIEEAAAKAAGAAKAQGGKVSVDLSSAAAIEAYGPERLLSRLELLEPDVVFANEGELSALAAPPPATTVVVKRGADGFEVDGRPYAAAAGEIVDTTGAGDALAAGFLVGGPELAAETAARCVAKLGAMP